MNDAQKAKFNVWLQEHDVRPECIACGTNQWEPGEVISGAVQTAGAITIGGPTIPMAQLVCRHCAAILLFAAVPIGLLE